MPTQLSRKTLLLAGLIFCLAAGIFFASCGTIPPSTRDILRAGFTELERAEAQLLPLREALRATLDEDEWQQLFR